MELVIAAPDFDELHRRLFSYAPEEAAAFLAVELANGHLLVRSFHVFEPKDLDGEAFGGVSVYEEAQVRELAAIKRAGHAVVEVHTHPGSGDHAAFSSYDDDELPAFARYVQNKLPGRPFGALVLAEAAYAGRAWSAERLPTALEIRAVGESTASPEWLRRNGGTPLDRSFDRQIRALGPAGQRDLSALRVGVVGLGGTGSQVVQQLAHLGVRNFVLVEDDRVERTNLPRLAGATWWDALLGRQKASVAQRLIRRLAPRATIAKTGSLRKPESLRALSSVDLIVGCVDNDGARLVLSELAAAYLVPHLDIGVGIEGHGDDRAIGGRVSFYLPGGACLACADELDFAEAAEDLEAEAVRRIRVERGYARERAVEPALMPLNTVLVGAAMVELLAFVTGVRPVIPFQRYDAIESRLIRQGVEPNEDCPVCRPAFAMGDRQAIDRYAITQQKGGK
jgi:molybdopterin/thiamine biosynthesis adenylyltransferase